MRACVQDLSLQHITNVSWAYASLGVVAPRLVAALREEVLRRAAAEQLSAQQLCNLLWSFALLRVRGRRLVPCRRSVQCCSDQQLSAAS